MKDWLRPRAQSKTEQDGSIRLNIEMPGISRDDIGIEVENATLTITGERKPIDEKSATYLLRERRYGTFSRTYNLGQQVDGEKIQARLENGVLSLLLPVKEQAKPRKIPVLSDDK